MQILVACEESQAVTIALRKLGHEAYRCDIIPCSGGHPEWHIQQDVLPLLNGYCFFKTCDGSAHYVLCLLYTSQPRLDSYTTDTITVEELMTWGESIKPIAQKACANSTTLSKEP